MVDVSFYMLVEEEGSFSLALYDSEKNVISNYSNLRQNVVNDYIENLENEREFFISWDEKKSEYLSIDNTLLKYLLENGNFVNSDFEKIEKSELTNISLLIRENREIEDKLDIFIEINDNLLSKKNIIDNYIYSQGIFYEVKGLGEFTLDELFQNIDKYELETYCSLI
ncbi:MAG: ATP-dependent helicase, partial [Fusobacterium periodonticum]|nr:ATP-dependent helicase [Fusobacterium periodonticum]